jgi:hypothetical protein
MAQVAQLQPFDQYNSLFTPSSHGSPLKACTGMRSPLGIILITPLVHEQSLFPCVKWLDPHGEMIELSVAKTCQTTGLGLGLSFSYQVTNLLDFDW